MNKPEAKPTANRLFVPPYMLQLSQQINSFRQRFTKAEIAEQVALIEKLRQPQGKWGYLSESINHTSI